MRQLEDGPALAPVDSDSQLFLESDASDEGCGAVLWQQSPRGGKSILGYFSKGWTTRTKQSAGEMEMKGILLAMRHFRPLVGRRHVQVLTDHQPLEGDIGAKTKCNLPMRLRWLEELQHYNLSIKYQRGVDNPMADWLSRDGVAASPLPVKCVELDSDLLGGGKQRGPLRPL
jgi:ribonuclease HI